MNNECDCAKKVRIEGTVKVFSCNDAIFAYAGSESGNMNSVVLKDFARDNNLCAGEYKASLNIEFCTKLDEQVMFEDIRVGDIFLLSGQETYVTVSGFYKTGDSMIVYCDCNHFIGKTFNLSLLRIVSLSEIDLSRYGFDVVKDGMWSELEYVMKAFGTDGNKYSIVVRKANHDYYLTVASIDKKGLTINTEVNSVHVRFLHQLQNILYDNFWINLVINNCGTADSKQ